MLSSAEAEKKSAERENASSIEQKTLWWWSKIRASRLELYVSSCFLIQTFLYKKIQCGNDMAAGHFRSKGPFSVLNYWWENYTVYKSITANN